MHCVFSRPIFVLLSKKIINTMKNKILLSLPLIGLMVLASSPIFAQSCNPNVPIDGGLSALLVAGAGYGIKKINDKRKEK